MGEREQGQCGQPGELRQYQLRQHQSMKYETKLSPLSLSQWWSSQWWSQWPPQWPLQWSGKTHQRIRCLQWVLVLQIGVFSFSAGVWAEEEEFVLDKMTPISTAPAVPPKLAFQANESSLKVMGRVDLTAEFNPVRDKWSDNRGVFRSWHGARFFFKVKASPQTSFFGEIVNQDFYAIDYVPVAGTKISLGKILVPFGDNRYFHYFYGGIQGKGEQGIFFQNVWAEHGVNLQTRWSDHVLIDTYSVNGMVRSNDGTEFPDPQQPASKAGKQALGLRVQWTGWDYVTVIGSAYAGYYWESRPLLLLGTDLYTDYGWLTVPLRFGLGVANLKAEKIPNVGAAQRRGDYALVAGRGPGMGEWRLRYGTFNFNTEVPSPYDSHSWELAYGFPIDVMRVLIARQWNFESHEEQDDDVFRVMVSLDF